MSRQLTGTLRAPGGAAVPNAEVIVIANRTEELSEVVRGSHFNFTTNGSGFYDTTLLNGYYRIARTVDGAQVNVGNIFVEDGPATTLTDLLALNELPPAPGELVVNQLVQDAEQAAADAAAALAAAQALFSGSPPVIATHPQSLSVTEGVAVMFAASAYNYQTVQWYRNGVAIAGATNTTFGFTPTEANQDDIYFARFTNPAGSIDSVHATLDINSIPVAVSQTVAAITGIGVFIVLGPPQDADGDAVTYSVTPPGNFTQNANTIIYTAPSAGAVQLDVVADDGNATAAGTIDIVAADTDSQAITLTFDNVVVS